MASNLILMASNLIAMVCFVESGVSEALEALVLFIPAVEVPFEESSLLPYEPDAAVDPPEELRRKGMMEEVMWRMRWLVSRVEAMEHKEPKKKEALSLGNGWVLIQSNLVPGRRFYFNMKSGESTWERPF
ncbi:unnamed protein product [Durusdinium trenchii]|uniref:Uncharacterized protein n=2 Tax=Durusdinium trenchii TaxID=1381693 RepID=A0ABP0QRM4_9DINO